MLFRSLYGKVHPDNFPNENDYRNPVIAVAMKTLGYVNQFGRGVETVQEELKANKNGMAVFKFDDITTFKVTVMSADLIEEDSTDSTDKTEVEQKNKNNVGDESEMSRRNVGEMSEKTVVDKLTDRQKEILKHIEQNNEISAKELSALLEITDRTVERDIHKLKKMGVLERIGSDRGGYWKIN